jgi:putative transposase
MVKRHSKKERYPMTQKKNTTDLTELLLKCMAQPDPMLSMLEWLCTRLMEAEVSGIVGAEKNAHNPSRRDYRCGYRHVDWILVWERCI